MIVEKKTRQNDKWKINQDSLAGPFF